VIVPYSSGDATLAFGNGAIQVRGLACALRLLAGSVRVVEVRADLLGDVGVALVRVGGGFVCACSSLGRFRGAFARISDPPSDVLIHGES
jgi:hypothetical protein